MKIRIIVLMILGVCVASVCFAQARDPGSSGVSDSTGVWTSIEHDHSDSVGYGSGDHGNVSKNRQLVNLTR